MIQKENIHNKIKEQKSELIKWNKELKLNLSKKLINKINIYLIDKNWLENYTKNFFNYKDIDNILFFEKYIKKYENIKLELQENSKFFILNEKCWKLFSLQKNEIKLEGYFLNKILFIIKNNIYFFFFLDKNNNEIKKGILKIDIINSNNDINNIIINYFKENNPFINNKIQNQIKINNKINISYILLEDNSIFEFKDENLYINKDLNPKTSIHTLLFNKKYPSQICFINYNSYKKDLNKKDEGIKCLKKIKLNNDIAHKILDNKEIDINNPRTKIIRLNKDLLNKNIINTENTTIKYDKERNKRIFDPDKEIKKIKRNSSVKQTSKYNIGKFSSLIIDLNDFLPKHNEGRISTPGLIGLSNNDTNYMNAIIQCFSNITRFRNILLNKTIYKDLEKNKLNSKKISFALAEVLKNLWEILTQKYFSSLNFKREVCLINPYFNNINNNIHPIQFINFLLEQLHNELNTRNINIIQNRFFNYFDLNDTINVYKKNYEERNNSIITKEFIGYYYSIERCINCKDYSYTADSFNILDFNLEDIIMNKNNNNINNIISIQECFEYYQREQIISYCNFCQNQKIRKNKLYIMPNTLIISFNYNKNLLNNIKVIFEQYLNLNKYVEYFNSNFYYELIGVISILDSNNNNNTNYHYISYCKNNYNCEWYKYDDEKVIKTNFGEVKSVNQPLVLFFSYVKA